MIQLNATRPTLVHSHHNVEHIQGVGANLILLLYKYILLFSHLVRMQFQNVCVRQIFSLFLQK